MSAKRPKNLNPVKDFVVCSAECSAGHPRKTDRIWKTGKTNKNSTNTEEQRTVAAIIGAILVIQYKNMIKHQTPI